MHPNELLIPFNITSKLIDYSFPSLTEFSGLAVPNRKDLNKESVEKNGDSIQEKHLANLAKSIGIHNQDLIWINHFFDLLGVYLTRKFNFINITKSVL